MKAPTYIVEVSCTPRKSASRTRRTAAEIDEAYREMIASPYL
jgi:hypothetical protein